jgi:CrcB protein
MHVGTYALVAIGGLIGAPARYLGDRAVARRAESILPWGTFAVNVSGSLLLGLLTGLSMGRHLGATVDDLAGTGFCGAYTTFSTFAYESVRLAESGQYLKATVNVASSVLIGMVAAALGLAVGLAA